jgi:MFS family permease
MEGMGTTTEPTAEATGGTSAPGGWAARQLAGPAARLREIRVAVRLALGNPGIRRLAFAWMLGIAADSALTVVTVVTVFNRGGILAAGLLGAVRMVPAVVIGMLSGSILARIRGERLLVLLGIGRGLAAAGIAWTIQTAGTTVPEEQVTMIQLFVFSTLAAAAAAPVRPTQATLMPAIARSPDELVAANTVWSTGEGIGAFFGPFVAGLLMASNLHAGVAAISAALFLATSFIAARIRFENAGDALAAPRLAARLHLLDGFRAVFANRILGWTIFGTFGQVITRGLMNAMIVVAAIELLNLGQSGTGLLTAALGIGGLLGAFFAMSTSRPERLIRTEIVALIFWGLPLAVIGITASADIAIAAMVIIGVANATYDVALFTILQRATPNADRAAVMSVLEVAIGLGAITGSLLAPLLLWIFGTRGGMIVGGLILPAIAVLMFFRIGRAERVGVVNEETVSLLRKVPAFAELPLTAVERIADGLVPFSSPAGTALMTQGEPGDRFVLIDQGEIDVLIDGQKVARLGQGAGVGEIALLRQSPRTATVVAVTDVTGYSVDGPTFLAAVAGPAAAGVAERMVQARLERGAVTSPSPAAGAA